jgi:hypothetical protein
MPINAKDKALVHSHTGQTRRLAKTDLQRNNHENLAALIVHVDFQVSDYATSQELRIFSCNYKTVRFLNFAVNRFALPNYAAFVSEGCIPARFVCQALQPHIVALAICMRVEP